jgi:hypothetical protein
MNERKTNTRVHDNYFICEELSSDSIGKNYRALEIQAPDEKPLRHRMVAKVYPFLFKTADEWSRANVLCERIKRANIPNFCVPEEIIKTGDSSLFVFPFQEGKTLAQIVEDADRLGKPVPVNIAFSIAVAIASLIEVGASISTKGHNAFHGFLTPDHIIVDYEGNVLLKYFGLWPLFDENEAAISEMIMKYGSWLTPEFIRREKIEPRSDFYYLGYVVYRMLTGNYFSYLPGEDFESTFTSISFVSDMPSTDIEFLTSLINLFKKTLNPNVNKRFATTREFKNHISKYFNVGEFAAFKSDLADYMNQLYGEAREEEKQALNRELSEPVPEKPLIDDIEDGELVEHIPVGIEERRRSKSLMIILIVVIIAAVAGGYFVVNQLDKAREEQQIATRLLEQQDKEKKEFERRLLEVQEKLLALEQQKTVTQEEKEAKREQIAQLRNREIELKKKEEARIKEIEKIKKETVKKPVASDAKPDAKPKDSAAEPQTGTTPPPTGTVKPAAGEDSAASPTDTGEDTDTAPPAEKETGKEDVIKTDVVEKETPPKAKEPTGVQAKDQVFLHSEVTVKPKKISGKKPVFSQSIRKTYAGRRATVSISMVVDASGNVESVDIQDKNRLPGEVQTVIIDALKKWKFNPAQKDGASVKSWFFTRLKINFRMM